jgi:hypothetical protein
MLDVHVVVDIKNKRMEGFLPITPLPCFWIVKCNEIIVSSELILSKREEQVKMNNVKSKRFFMM